MKVRLPFCLGLALLAATLTCPALAQQSSARVALVIGNASYPGAGTPPANTVEDARTLAEELGRSGFDVELEEDVGKVEMERAIDAFMGRIRSGTAALFYFGGYGIQVARQSYLIPVNAQIWAQPHVRRDGISLDAVLAQMDRRGAKATFDMGSSRQYENPVHPVTIAKPFAIGRHEVTFDEWDKCADEGGCKHRPDDRQWGRGDRPVINVNWLDAKAFTIWLSRKTGQTYRLPSEAEWEYATRGGTETPYWWGRSVGSRHANCVQCNTGGPRRNVRGGIVRTQRFRSS